MGCCHHYAFVDGGDEAFSVNTNAITFGHGCLREAGDHAAALGLKRVALFTDKRLKELENFAVVRCSLEAAGIDVVVYDEVAVEPTDESFKRAADAAVEIAADGFVSFGGGSVMDTAKAANLYASHPADFLAYVNAPIGEGKQPPDGLRPHIACPTTSGTGSECTGIAVFDLLARKLKTGIVSKHLKPTMALVDPTVTHTLPKNVIAASAFDVLSHALESYTARPFTRRPAPARPSERPMSQGANPWSDLGCREALTLLGEHMVTAVNDADAVEAREQLMWAATLAGIAFGNAGVHVPHGMSYAVAGLVRSFRPEGYPQDIPLVPHGMSVIVNAPAVFRLTAPACPDRHLAAAGWLGAKVGDATPDEAGDALAEHLVGMMRATGMPNGLEGVGYAEDDVEALTEGAAPQTRLLDNAPCDIGRDALSGLFNDAMRYW